jgi:hypothetical protein
MLSSENSNSPKIINEIKYSWEENGLELLHQKTKIDFTPSEKQLIKNMLKESPPPLQYRRRVIINK